MTTTMSAHVPSPLDGRAAAGMPDDLTAPPFAALQRLHDRARELDETISTLIGQLQPYVDDQSITATRVEAESAKRDTFGSSSLERTIVAEAETLAELNARLSETCRALRL